jgi:hypothetical protein
MINWKGFGTNRAWHNEVLSHTCLEELRIITELLSQDSRCPGRDLNQAPPEYRRYSRAKLLGY